LHHGFVSRTGSKLRLDRLFAEQKGSKPRLDRLFAQQKARTLRLDRLFSQPSMCAPVRHRKCLNFRLFADLLCQLVVA